MDDRKRQGKSTEDVGLVSKVKPLKCPKLWTLWKTWPYTLHGKWSLLKSVKVLKFI